MSARAPAAAPQIPPQQGQEAAVGGEFRLTPFLAMGTTPSPWNLIDWNKVPGTTPTPAQASIHKLERNQFESSFGAAIYHPDADKEDEGAAVPQMAVSKARSARNGGPAVPSDRIVPDASAPTSATRKTKVTTGRAGKTSKTKPSSGSPKKRNPISEKERREKRREQNRRNAAKCRQRKLDRVSELTEQLDELRAENDTLKEDLARIEKRVAQRRA